MFLNVQLLFIDTITFFLFDEIMSKLTVLTSMFNIYIELQILGRD